MNLVTELCEICEPNGGEFIWKFGGKTSEQDESVVMIFGLHGDELGPVEALKILLPEIMAIQDLLRGEVTLILGSPLALEKGSRGVEVDPNRIFGKVGDTMDHIRVAQIQNAISQANPDVLVDYHCTRNKSVPFVFVPKGEGNHDDALTKSITAAHSLRSVVLADWHTYTDSANEVDHWAVEMSAGKIRAITVETGWLKDRSLAANGPIGITMNGVKRALSVLGIYDFDGFDENEFDIDDMYKWDVFGGIYAGEGFEWSGVVRNFGVIEIGQVHGHKNGVPLIAEETFATMFVKNNGDFDSDNSAQRVALMMRRVASTAT